jgi:23S rRNA pseudouridine2457 synthase
VARLILFNKPYGVLCQFTGDGTRPTLADHIDIPGVYVAGRLDADSEGLLALTGDGRLQARIADPRHKLPKIYWAQVEGEPDAAALKTMAAGLDLGDFVTRPCRVRRIDEPAGLWPRDPPIRYRAAIPTCWLEIELREGKNRQVRRMTAKIGHPTLRLIRAAIGPWSLGDLAPGAWTAIDVNLPPASTPPSPRSRKTTCSPVRSRSSRRSA